MKAAISGAILTKSSLSVLFKTIQTDRQRRVVWKYWAPHVPRDHMALRSKHVATLFLNGSACNVHTFWYALECCLLKANLLWCFFVVLPFLCSLLSLFHVMPFLCMNIPLLFCLRVFCVLCSYLPVTFGLFQNIYIYAFSRHFYPKHLSKTCSHFCYEVQVVSSFDFLLLFGGVLCYRNFSILHLCSLPHHASWVVF